MHYTFALYDWLVVSTHLKNMIVVVKLGNLPQIVVNLKNYLKPPARFALHDNYSVGMVYALLNRSSHCQ